MWNPFAAHKELARIANRLRAHKGATVFDRVDAVADKLSAAIAENFGLRSRLETSNKNCGLFLSQRNRAFAERDEARAALKIHEEREAKRMAGREKAVIASAAARKSLKPAANDAQVEVAHG